MEVVWSPESDVIPGIFAGEILESEAQCLGLID